MQEESLKLLLQSAIVKELEQLDNKFRFWQAEVPVHPQTFWESCRRQPIPNVDQLVSLISEQTFQEADDELKTLCGIGWEFIWGKSTPSFVTREKELLRQRSAQEESLSGLERLWLTISAVDTDYF